MASENGTVGISLDEKTAVPLMIRIYLMRKHNFGINRILLRKIIMEDYG